MLENYKLKRKCIRSNYRVVAEIKNNGEAEFLVEFKKPFITFNLIWPIFNLIGRWEPVFEYLAHPNGLVNNSITPNKIHVGKKIGWNEVTRDCKEDAYTAIENELGNKEIQYGNLINKRKVV